MGYQIFNFINLLRKKYQWKVQSQSSIQVQRQIFYDGKLNIKEKKDKNNNFKYKITKIKIIYKNNFP